MFRLLVVTLVAIFGILQVFGDPARRPEPVARSSALEVELIPAAYLPSVDDPVTTYVSPISDAEAVKMALAAGDDLRQTRSAAALRGTSLAPPAPETVAIVVTEPAVEAPALWNVTGTRVNLRSGPGTSNAIVGQVTQGTQAEMLSEADGWYEIRSTDGAVSGWIFGKFLQPG
ncbi:MAG: SH3 domain-containing protein [Pseudomonadota bacterium]